jgi:phosphoserine aminotransferase
VLGAKDTIYRVADLSPDGAWLAVTSDVEIGRPRAGLYNLGTQQWKWLKPIIWDQSAIRFTRDGKSLLVESSDDLRTTLVRYDIATGTESPLKMPAGLNYTTGNDARSPDGRSLLVVNMAANVAGELTRYDLADDSVTPITRLALASLRPEALAASQMVTYTSFDGTRISALVTMPANLKRDGSNPAIVLPHGGPTGKTDDYFDDIAAALASRGYIIIAPNFRGSTGYGKDFQAANYNDMGGGDLKDVIAAKQFLVRSGYADPKRVGIFGGSYGGFMSLMAIGKAPDAFAAAVQLFGIINWRTMYRDMDEVLKAYLRSLMGIPSGYRVLFLQGGATGQFTAVPMNLASAGAVVDYLDTGIWSGKAIAEARRFCTVNIVAEESASGYTTVPRADSLRFTPGAAYAHYTPNETIGGVEFPYVPHTGGIPLVADLSSTILSRPLDVSRFGLIYAGAQKNIGPAGLVIVIVRDDLVGKARSGTPLIWDYALMAKEGSMLNTPPTFGLYIAGLVFRWLKGEGGLEAVGERNRAKARLLYDFIDHSGFYRSPVAPDCRSWMNLPFRIVDPALERSFCALAAEAGLVNLEGHRLLGGMRASLYNAMPMAGVEALVAFMREFQRRYG